MRSDFSLKTLRFLLFIRCFGWVAGNGYFCLGETSFPANLSGKHLVPASKYLRMGFLLKEAGLDLSPKKSKTGGGAGISFAEQVVQKDRQTVLLSGEDSPPPCGHFFRRTSCSEGSSDRALVGWGQPSAEEGEWRGSIRRGGVGSWQARKHREEMRCATQMSLILCWKVKRCSLPIYIYFKSTLSCLIELDPTFTQNSLQQ